MLGNIIVLYVLLLAVPEVVGMLYTGFLPEGRNGILMNWAAGYIILWGLFEVVALPMIFQRKTLDFLCIIYGSMVLLLMIVALAKSYRRIIPMVKDGLLSVKERSLIGWGNFLLILGQAIAYVKYMPMDDDDAFYVAAAVGAVSTNSIFSIDPYTGMEFVQLPSRYVLSPFFSFVAFLSKVSGVHPAVVAHVVFASVLIALSYAIYVLLGKKLFPDHPRQSEYFVFFVILIVLFSGYTVYTQGMFTLVRIWQGKAVLCAVLVPMAFYMMLHLIYTQGVAADWCFLFMLMCACCLVSSMGIMLGAVMMGIFGILHILRHRSIKTFLCILLCCIPNIVCAGLYLLLR